MNEVLKMEDYVKKQAPQPDAEVWPKAQPIDGNVYGFTCQFTNVAMVAMTRETFARANTYTESIRRSAQELDKKCKSLAAGHNQLVSEFNDLKSRHEALRDAMRRDRRAALTGEQQIVIPDGSGRLPSIKR